MTAALVDELRRRKRELAAEVETRSRKIAELNADLATKKRALAAIDELLRIEGGDAEETDSTPVPLFGEGGGRTNAVADEVVRILSERREPLHYNDLFAQLQARGVTLPGQNPANTLLARLSRDARFYRPSRGTYALREWNPKARSVGVRRTKKSA